MCFEDRSHAAPAFEILSVQEGCGNAPGTPCAQAVGVYLCLLATAAVDDMPVGAPSPFTSALEQAPGRTRTRHSLKRTWTSVDEPLAFGIATI
jgi:hypothetical protein